MFLCTSGPQLDAVLRALRDESGQALVEAPLVLVITTMLVLVLLQPAVMLYSKALANGAAAAACRVVATDDLSYGGGSAAHDATIERWVIDRRLAALPNTSLFQARRPTVRVERSTDWVSVTVKIVQKPLPLVGTFFAMSLTGSSHAGLVTIRSKATAPAALMGISGSQADDSGTYGQPRSR